MPRAISRISPKDSRSTGLGLSGITAPCKASYKTWQQHTALRQLGDLLILQRITTMACRFNPSKNRNSIGRNNENKGDDINSSFVSSGSSSGLCRQPQYWHLEVERGQVEDSADGAEEQPGGLRGCGGQRESHRRRGLGRWQVLSQRVDGEIRWQGLPSNRRPDCGHASL